MLVVKVELWPGGNQNRAKQLGFATIANISNLRDISDYQVTMTAEPPLNDPSNRIVSYEGKVVDYNRKKFDVWHLIKEALNTIVK